MKKRLILPMPETSAAPRLDLVAPAQPSLSERQRLLAVMEQSNQIAAAATLEALIDGMLDLVLEVTGAASATYFQLDPDSDELVVSAVRADEESQHLIGLRFKREAGLLDGSAPSSQPVVVGELTGDPRWLRAVYPERAARMRNIVSLPLETQGRLIGLVQLFNFEQAELDLLEVLRSRLAGEIERRSQYNQAQRANRRLRILIDAIGQAAGTLDRNQLLHMITENACRLVDAERSSIFLVDPATKEMIFQVSFHSPDRPATGPLAAGAARLGRPRPANRPQEEFSFFSRSGITVPLTNGPVSPDQETDRKRTLGGLMALNKQGQSFQEDDADLLSILAEQASSFLQVVELYESTGELFVDVIKSFVTAIDAKDPYTQGHSQRVSDYSVMIAQELGLSDTQVNDIRVSSLLHDIGKIGVSDTILKKAGRLTPAEYEEIKQHPTIGANILSQVKALAPVLPGILEHHERLNGAGYPQCLQGAQISLMGRIIAVADVFDAMTSHRPYRPALSVAEVIAYLKENIGVQFDADCVRALENILIRSYEAD